MTTQLTNTQQELVDKRQRLIGRYNSKRMNISYASIGDEDGSCDAFIEELWKECEAIAEQIHAIDEKLGIDATRR